jgi:hypothetical protein
MNTLTQPALAVAFAVAVAAALVLAVASRYPKASALGLSNQSKKAGFSPWICFHPPTGQTDPPADNHTTQTESATYRHQK